MIPKIIHQIWLGDQSIRPEPLMHTWKNMNPDWEHKVWTEDNMPKLRNQAQFDAVEELAGKADIFRYELLFDHGGFFIDADSECVKPLGDDFVSNDSFCCWENEQTRKGLMANGYLGACKHNVLIMRMIQHISMMSPDSLSKLPPKASWQVLGPALLTKYGQTYENLKVYPSHYFIPKHYSGVDQSDKSPIYGKQYYMSTPQSERSYEEFRS